MFGQAVGEVVYFILKIESMAAHLRDLLISSMSRVKTPDSSVKKFVQLLHVTATAPCP